MKVRMILSSSEGGNDERVMFTDDIDAPVTDLVAYGLTADDDRVIEIDLPSGFPMNYDLKRM